jgi:hypothetical protein
MEKTMKSVLTGIVCAGLGMRLAAAANLDPSLKDTLEWLQATIAQHANNGEATGAPCDSNRQNRPCRFKYIPVDFTGCSITYQFEGEITIGNERRQRKATVVVPLWELATPQARREQDNVPTWLVPLSLREDARFPIRVDEDADPNYLPGRRSYEDRFVWLEFADFNTDNQAMAQRVARAFAHAIELCDGRKWGNGEPF